MSDLMAFLRARLDEDETTATAATAGPWVARDLSDATFDSPDKAGWWWVWREGVPHYAGVMEVDHADPEVPVGMAAITDHDHGATERADAMHVARWDPARVLAEVAAKREILRMFEVREEQSYLPGGGVAACHATGLLLALRQLIQVYAEHPDFDPAWAVWP